MSTEDVAQTADAKQPMSRATLFALRSAVAKWKLMAHDSSDVVDIARKIECPLCALFNTQGAIRESDCQGCPVYQSTGARYCAGTPYESWAEADDLGSDEGMQAAAVAEVDFLKTLIPEQDDFT